MTLCDSICGRGCVDNLKRKTQKPAQPEMTTPDEPALGEQVEQSQKDLVQLEKELVEHLKNMKSLPKLKEFGKKLEEFEAQKENKKELDYMQELEKKNLLDYTDEQNNLMMLLKEAFKDKVDEPLRTKLKDYVELKIIIKSSEEFKMDEHYINGLVDDLNTLVPEILEEIEEKEELVQLENKLVQLENKLVEHLKNMKSLPKLKEFRENLENFEAQNMNKNLSDYINELKKLMMLLKEAFKDNVDEPLRSKLEDYLLLKLNIKSSEDSNIKNANLKELKRIVPEILEEIEEIKVRSESHAHSENPAQYSSLL